MRLQCVWRVHMLRICLQSSWKAYLPTLCSSALGSAKPQSTCASASRSVLPYMHAELFFNEVDFSVMYLRCTTLLYPELRSLWIHLSLDFVGVDYLEERRWENDPDHQERCFAEVSLKHVEQHDAVFQLAISFPRPVGSRRCVCWNGTDSRCLLPSACSPLKAPSL
eukprot:384372-Amphidinium_carterae.1